MQLHLEISGIPPKKDGANSMWRKSVELQRLKALRTEVARELEALGQPLPAGHVSLSLKIYAPASAGDLDNFITGVCDGLMAAHPNTPIDLALWSDVPMAAKPDRALMFADDSRVSKISAERLPGELQVRYELDIEFL